MITEDLSGLDFSIKIEEQKIGEHTKYCVTSRLTRKVLFFVRWPNLIKCSFFTVFKYLPPTLHFPLKGKVLCKNKGRAKKSPWSPILTEGGVSLVEH